LLERVHFERLSRFANSHEKDGGILGGNGRRKEGRKEGSVSDVGYFNGSWRHARIRASTPPRDPVVLLKLTWRDIILKLS
jgi:hypothetical protein